MIQSARIDRARQLRRSMTDAERKLWRVLRARGLGPRFRRQEPIGPFVVDFAAFEEWLVIELDGGQHAESRSDPARDAYLRAQGFTVLRFWNNDVLANLEAVVTSIRTCFARPSP